MQRILNYFLGLQHTFNHVSTFIFDLAAALDIFLNIPITCNFSEHWARNWQAECAIKWKIFFSLKSWFEFPPKWSRTKRIRKKGGKCLSESNENLFYSHDNGSWNRYLHNGIIYLADFFLLLFLIMHFLFLFFCFFFFFFLSFLRGGGSGW